MRTSGDKKFAILGHIIMIILSFAAVIPIILMVISSLTDNAAILKNGYSFLPEKWSAYAYQWIFAFNGGMVIRAYGVSFLLTAVGTLCSVLLTIGVAYGLSKKGLPGRGLLTFYVVFTMLFNGGLVPSYMMWTQTFHIKKPYRTACDLDVHLDKETYLKEFGQNMNASDYTELPMKCYNGFYDVIIMDKKGMEYCGMQEITYPLKKYLPADIYTLVEDRVVETAGYDGSVVPFAIDISDTDFAKSLNLGYDDVYIGFPGNTDQNYKNAKRMLKYILNLDIDTETTY